MFSTLTTTTRRLEIGDVPLLLSDTVGFISRLPHYMIEAFKSTLEELTYADLVLLVVDASDPEDRFRMKYQTCLETLADLNVSPHKTIVVMNKVDLIGAEEVSRRASALEPWAQAVVLVSAKTGEGIEELLSVIRKGIQEAAELDLILPPEKASSLSEKAKFFGNVVRVEKAAAEGGKVRLIVVGPEWAIRELSPREAAGSPSDE